MSLHARARSRRDHESCELVFGRFARHRHGSCNRSHEDGLKEWIGSAVYDKRVGLSHSTGRITHVTAPDVDTERDYLMQCLDQTGELSEQDAVPNFHKELEGCNGGGDPWYTDGDLEVGVLNMISLDAFTLPGLTT